MDILLLYTSNDVIVKLSLVSRYVDEMETASIWVIEFEIDG